MTLGGSRRFKIRKGRDFKHSRDQIQRDNGEQIVKFPRGVIVFFLGAPHLSFRVNDILLQLGKGFVFFHFGVIFCGGKDDLERLRNLRFAIGPPLNRAGGFCFLL